jgi:hypothetical protein
MKNRTVLRFVSLESMRVVLRIIAGSRKQVAYLPCISGRVNTFPHLSRLRKLLAGYTVRRRTTLCLPRRCAGVSTNLAPPWRKRDRSKIRRVARLRGDLEPPGPLLKLRGRQAQPWNMPSVRARLDQRDSAFETLPNASTRLMMVG